MPELQPDIEIYIKRPAFGDLIRWLERYFQLNAVNTEGAGKILDLGFDDKTLQCLIIDKVTKGGYTSVWFKRNQTPWQDDLACAEDAHRVLQVESRCSVGGWDSSNKEKGGWYRLCNGEKSIVNWLE